MKIEEFLYKEDMSEGCHEKKYQSTQMNEKVNELWVTEEKGILDRLNHLQKRMMQEGNDIRWDTKDRRTETKESGRRDEIKSIKGKSEE